MEDLESRLSKLELTIIEQQLELLRLKWEGKIICVNNTNGAYLISEPMFERVTKDNEHYIVTYNPECVIDLDNVSLYRGTIKIDEDSIITGIETSSDMKYLVEEFKYHEEKLMVRHKAASNAIEAIAEAFKYGDEEKKEEGNKIEETYKEFKEKILDSQDDFSKVKNDIIDNMQERVVQVGGLVNKLMEDLQYQDGDDGDS